MMVKSQMATPVKKKDGTWDVVIEEFEEDIPDKGRGCLFCNACAYDGFPECREWCTAYLPADEQKRINKAKRLAQKNAEN